jgi:hypothetical protein
MTAKKNVKKLQEFIKKQNAILHIKPNTQRPNNNLCKPRASK